MNSPTKRLTGRLIDVERRADLFQPAVAKHRDPVGHRHGFGLIVRDVDHGDADLAVDALDLDLHLLAQVLVERAERLVEQQHVGIEHEAARQRHALLLAAGQFARIAVGECGRGRRDRASCRRGRRTRRAGRRRILQREHDVLRRRHVRKQRVVLEHHADVALVGLARAPDRVPSSSIAPLGRTLEAGDHHQRRGLAGAARAEEGDELAALDVDRNIVDGIGLAVIRLDDVAQAADRPRRHRSPVAATLRRSAHRPRRSRGLPAAP